MNQSMLWLPNALTCLRILLCPFIVVLFLAHRYPLGLLLFLLAATTDFLDGYLARRLGAQTAFGALLDPFSDKLFALSLFALLMSLKLCPPWFLGLWISVNLIQTLGYLLIRLTHSAPFPVAPLRIAKWNTTVQFVWIGVGLFDVFLCHTFPHNFRYSPLFHFVGYIALSALQVVVFLRYFIQHRRELLLDLRAPTPPAAV